MRLSILMFVAGFMSLLPAKLFAADIALILNNVGGAGFDREGEINREFGSLEQAYRDDGFETIVGVGADRDRMWQLLRDFEARSRDADRVVIHYIGRLERPIYRKYLLVPTNGVPESIVERHTSGLDLDLVYELLSHRAGRSAFILGSPKHWLPLELAASDHSIPNGLMVLTMEGLDSVTITRDKLLREDATGRQIDALPNAAVLGFLSDQNLAARQAPAPRPDSRSAADEALVEMRVWREAAQIGTSDALRAYLDQYPNGLFRGEAQARLDALAPRKSLDETIEENLRLTRTDRRAIQQNLTALGFDTRGVDGLFGPGTRRAVGDWQRTEGFRSTGFLDRTQINVLRDKAAAKAAADRQQREQEDLAHWQATGSGTNEQGLRDYLARFPEGLFATQAKQALARIDEQKAGQQNEALANRENALGMTPQTRRLAEQRLAGLGYDVGPVDGNFTSETRRAIAQFQQTAGLKSTGYLDNQTVTRLVASIFR